MISLRLTALSAGLMLSSACSGFDPSSDGLFGHGGSTASSSSAAGTGASGGGSECTSDNVSTACDDMNACTDDICQSGYCVNAPSAIGTLCGPDAECKGNGTCVPNEALIWAKLFGGIQDQVAYAMAVDPAGSVVLTGRYADTIDFGGGSLPQAPSPDAFVARLDPKGNHLWSKGIHTPNTPFAISGAAFDEEGNILIAGGFWGSVDFGGGPLIAMTAADIFLAKLDATGNHVWSKQFGGDIATDLAQRIVVDPMGNLILLGVSFGGPVDFGGGPLPPVGNYDAVVVKLDAAGNHLFSKRFGEIDAQAIQSIAVDGSGNIIFAGSLATTADFGGNPLTSAGQHDLFVVKLDPAGNHLFSKRFGDAQDQFVTTVAADGFGNIVIGGQFRGKIDFFNGTSLDSSGGAAFGVMLDPSGNPRWVRTFGDSGGMFSVALDTWGNAVFAGYFHGTVNLGGGPISSTGENDMFLAKYDMEGTPLWSRHFGDTFPSPAGTVLFDGAGQVYAAGHVIGGVDLGKGPLQSEGGMDIFVAKYLP